MTSDGSVAGVIQEYLPLIRRIAVTMLARARCPLDVDDLVSAGTIGLLAAMARYDPARAVKFRTYAEYRIRGMMLDEIRSMDWVPRSVRTRHDRIYKAASVLRHRDGRPPSRDDIAKLLGISHEEVEGSALTLAPIVSLEEPVTRDEETYTLKDMLVDTEHPDPFQSCLSMEMRQALEQAFQRLTDKQQRVLHLYYFRGWSMKEVGREMKLTESGVCRIHAAALRRLHEDLHEYADDEPSRDRLMSAFRERTYSVAIQRHSESRRSL